MKVLLNNVSNSRNMKVEIENKKKYNFIPLISNLYSVVIEQDMK